MRPLIALDVLIPAGATFDARRDGRPLPHVARVPGRLMTTASADVPLKGLTFGEVIPAAGSTVRQEITLQQGIPEDVAKKLQKLIRDQFPKVQPRIQGDALRIGSKSRDELQGVIKLVKERQDDFTVPLQFTNYR